MRENIHVHKSKPKKPSLMGSIICKCDCMCILLGLMHDFSEQWQMGFFYLLIALHAIYIHTYCTTTWMQYANCPKTSKTCHSKTSHVLYDFAKVNILLIRVHSSWRENRINIYGRCNVTYMIFLHIIHLENSNIP